MKNLVPTARPVLDFEPVPRKYRYDGWTAERQRAFIAALAETGSVKAAARRINMSHEGAYYLRRQPGAESFRAAWAAALDHGVQRLADAVMERAIDGVPIPIMWKGEQVAERRVYNDRTAMMLLAHHMPEVYGRPGLREGTRSRETIEREAAENCPVCKARTAEAEAEANPDAEELRARGEWLDAMLVRYTAKLRHERRARLDGNVVAADFTVRQLTLIELMLGMADATPECQALWTAAIRQIGEGDLDPGEDEQGYAMAVCAMLDNARHTVWREQDMLRPITSPADGLGPFTTPSGYGANERVQAQHQARMEAAQAQALWEAAATEEGWRVWCGAGEGEGGTAPLG